MYLSSLLLGFYRFTFARYMFIISLFIRFTLFIFSLCVPIHEVRAIMFAGSDVWRGTGWSEWLQGREKAHYGANYEQRVHFVPIQELTAIM